MKSNVLTGPIATGSIPPCSLHSCTKRDIMEYFENAYSLDEWLYTTIKDDEYFCKSPDRLRLPLIFYYAHTAVVFVNKFLLAGLIKKRVNHEFEALFETGVDEMSWDDTENYRMGGTFKWPPMTEVREYRLQVREMVRKVIEETPLQLPITKESKWWAIFMGIEHQRIHLETSSVLIRQLPVEMVEKPEQWRYHSVSTEHKDVENPMVEAGDEIVTIGKETNSRLWGWDNEYGHRQLRVPKFEASKYPITNGEYLIFVQDGGYENRKFWSNEGWRWKTFRKARHPTFWVCSKECKSGCGSTLSSRTHCANTNIREEYGLRLMFDVVPLPRDWPVEVNYLEAKAFCAWKGAGFRLPTEAEHHVMRGSLPVEPAHQKNGKSNICLQYGSSTPVGMYPASTSGFCDVFGNVWEWVEDHFNGLPGGETHYLYDDFSAPCYDGKHNMILGGSWASTGGEATTFARYSFRRHFFQHLGFRVARTLDIADPSPVLYVKSKVYVSGHGEQESDIDLQLAREWGLEPILSESTSCAICDDNNANLSRLIEEQYCLNASLKHIVSCHFQEKHGKALVIGCGPGKMAFELTANFDKVVGCDVYGRCVDFAKRLADQRKMTYSILDTASGKKKNLEISLPEGCDPSKVTFKHLTWIPAELGLFDVIVVDGLERLSNKKAWIAVLPNLARTSDTVIVICNCDRKTKELLDSIFDQTTRKKCVVHLSSNM